VLRYGGTRNAIALSGTFIYVAASHEMALFCPDTPAWTPVASALGQELLGSILPSSTVGSDLVATRGQLFLYGGCSPFNQQCGNKIRYGSLIADQSQVRVLWATPPLAATYATPIVADADLFFAIGSRVFVAGGWGPRFQDSCPLTSFALDPIEQLSGYGSSWIAIEDISFPSFVHATWAVVSNTLWLADGQDNK
jgi:hypothetical protein